MTKPKDDTPTGGKAPAEPNSSLEERMLATRRQEEARTSGHMTEAEFKAFMDEMWGEEEQEGDLEMAELTVPDIPGKVLVRLEKMAANRKITVEDLARDIIYKAVSARESSKLVEITEEQFQQNIDALMAAYDQEPIAIIDDKGPRFVLMPLDVYAEV